jgi:hypothetical protein
MSTFLKIVRYIFSIIFFIILLALLLIGLPLISASKTVTDREAVKSIIDNTGVYNNPTETIFKLIPEEQILISDNNDLAGQILLLTDEDSQIRGALDTVLNSPQLKVKVDTVIDSFYDWFEGKSQSPDFEVYLIDDEETFKELYTSLLTIKFQNLPVCDTTSLEDINSNLLEAKCRPSFIDTEEIQPIIEAQLTSEQIQPMMEEFKLSSDQLGVSITNTTQVQWLYSIVNRIPIIVVALIALFTLLLIITIPGIKAGFITTSILYILSGGIILTTTLLRNITQNILTLTNLPITATTDINTQGFTTIFNQVINPIFQQTSSQLKTYSLIVLGLGILMLIVGIILKKKNKTPEIESNEE